MSSISAEPNEEGVAGFGAFWFSVFCVAVYLLGFVALLGSMLRHTHGTFVYALDDPYIHLALAEQIAHGHYGINPGEVTSPASSLLWPFLLVPLAGTHLQMFLPLVWNAICAAATAWLIGACVVRWSALRPGCSLLGNERFVWTKRAIVAVLLLLVANVWTLTFVGMEHCLEVLLAVVCAYGVTEVVGGRPLPVAAVVAAALLPSVRYEGMALTVGVAMAMYGSRRRWMGSVALLVVSIVPLAGFALFLHAHGLPMLPNSVLVKSHAAVGSHGPIAPLVRIVTENLRGLMEGVERWPAAILAVLLVQLWWNERDGRRRWAVGGAALAAVLQVLLGPNGWFTRYEVYAVAFATVILVRMLAERPPFLFLYFATGLLFFGMPYVLSTQRVISAELEVYHQQFQMHRFVQTFYRGNVAVNDLGLVSYQRPQGTYVLDLWGLASAEASSEAHKNGAWLRRIAERHDAALAMIYPSWFESVPASWQALGSVCITDSLVSLSQRCVVFYSTEPTRRAELQGDMDRFAATLPADLEYLRRVARVSNARQLTPTVE